MSIENKIYIDVLEIFISRKRVDNMKELRKIREHLKEMAEKEATKLFRFAWKAQKHGCKHETVEAIRNEARWLHETAASGYPDRLIYWKFEYDFKYAFRLEGEK